MDGFALLPCPETVANDISLIVTLCELFSVPGCKRFRGKSTEDARELSRPHVGAVLICVGRWSRRRHYQPWHSPKGPIRHVFLRIELSLAMGQAIYSTNRSPALSSPPIHHHR